MIPAGGVIMLRGEGVSAKTAIPSEIFCQKRGFRFEMTVSTPRKNSMGSSNVRRGGAEKRVRKRQSRGFSGRGDLSNNEKSFRPFKKERRDKGGF